MTAYTSTSEQLWATVSRSCSICVKVAYQQEKYISDRVNVESSSVATYSLDGC